MSGEAKTLLGIGLGTVVILVVGVFLLSSGQKTTQSQPTTQKTDAKLLKRDNSTKVIGKNPKVEIVEFADFQCPACGVAHPVVKQILEKYGDNIAYYYRNFPLPQHKNAPMAAEAAESANKQGKFIQMNDLLFENQSKWSDQADPMPIFESYAQSIGLNMDEFKKSVESQEFKQKINGDVSDGQALSVNATPTFYLNGERVTFEKNYNELQTKVAEFLK